MKQQFSDYALTQLVSSAFANGQECLANPRSVSSSHTVCNLCDLSKNVDPDQTPLKAASDQGLHCLSLIQNILDTLAGNKIDLSKS